MARGGRNRNRNPPSRPVPPAGPAAVDAPAPRAGGDADGPTAAGGGPDVPVTPPKRRFLVFDGDGELVAAFPTWEAAHAWSHMRASEPLTMLPVRIEDHVERRTWTIDADQCRMTVWRRHVEYRICLPEQLLPSAEAHSL